MKNKKLKIFIDGGSRGNPGHGACAAVIFDEKDVIIGEEGKYLGHCTNNFAEYTGFILALSTALRLGASELVIFSDSELLVRQFNGEYRIKDSTLQVLMGEIKKGASAFKRVTVAHVPRGRNTHADKLVNIILDNARAMKNPGLAEIITKECERKLHQPKLF
ncbi:MAG: ribonuclease HI family protein [Elusimicrobiota bacterium]